jgi:hypothetical protein
MECPVTEFMALGLRGSSPWSAEQVPMPVRAGADDAVVAPLADREGHVPVEAAVVQQALRAVEMSHSAQVISRMVTGSTFPCSTGWRAPSRDTKRSEMK